MFIWLEKLLCVYFKMLVLVQKTEGAGGNSKPLIQTFIE